MLKRLKQFLFVDLEAIKTDLAILVSRKKEVATDASLMRHLLGSIDLKDVKPVGELKEGERRDFAASIAIVYPKLHRILKPMIDEQKDFALTNDGDPQFCKGTINGFYLVLEAFEAWRSEHIENTTPRESFDKYATLPELLERYARPTGIPSQTPGEKVD